MLIKVSANITLSYFSVSLIATPLTNKRVPVTVDNRPQNVKTLPAVMVFQLSQSKV
jgi:hypothetical protein